jgi:large subunit ribosomal protein L10
VKKKADKEKEAQALQADLAKVSTVILTTFQGITVEQDNKLRRAVQTAGGRYRVVKNTLAEQAAKGTPAEPLLKSLSGTNSIAYTAADPVALAKVLARLAKEVPAFRFKAGVVEGRVLSIEELQQLAQLPSKEELMGKIVFSLQALVRRLASVLAVPPRNLAGALHEVAKENKFAR